MSVFVAFFKNFAIEPREMKNLVIGLVKGYTFEKIRPFITSLRATDYDGDICLLYSDLDTGTVNSLRQYGVDLVPFELGAIDLAFKRVYIFSLLQKVYGSRLNLLFPLHRLFAGFVDF